MSIVALNFHAVAGQYFHSPIRSMSSFLHTVVSWSIPRWWLILDELTFIMRIHHKITVVGPMKTPQFSSISGRNKSECLLSYIDITVSRFCKVRSLPSIVEILEKCRTWSRFTHAFIAFNMHHESHTPVAYMQ